ncbi:MAG TPA: hypothetical protein PLY45_00435 [bacterium]|nr:hypothetical protein [bacterium]
MAELCQSIQDGSFTGVLCSDLNFTGRPESFDPKEMDITGATTASVRGVLEMGRDVFVPEEQCKSMDDVRFAPAVGTATAANLWCDQTTRTEKIEKERGTAFAATSSAIAGGGIMAAGGAILWYGSVTAWSPVGWGLIAIGGLAIAGGGIAILFAPERKIVDEKTTRVPLSELANKDSVLKAFKDLSFDRWPIDARRMNGEFVNVVRAGAASSDADVKRYMPKVETRLATAFDSSQVCIDAAKELVKIYAPVDMDEADFMNAIDATAGKSGDAEMGRILKAGYLAQKALEAAKNNPSDNDAVQSMIERSRSYLPALCANGGMTSSADRDAMVRAVYAIIDEAQGGVKKAPAPTQKPTGSGKAKKKDKPKDGGAEEKKNPETKKAPMPKSDFDCTFEELANIKNSKMEAEEKARILKERKAICK